MASELCSSRYLSKPLGRTMNCGTDKVREMYRFSEYIPLTTIARGVCSAMQPNQYSHTGRTTEPRTDTLHPLTEQSSRQSRWSNLTSEATLPSGAQSGNNLANYTSILFEIGQAEGKKVERTASELDLDLLQFKVTIRFRKLRASGIRRQNKIAGHLAAKKLCHRLGIRV